ALDQLLPYQRDDFVGIFKAMNSLPVTIRLIDPPLHEFLPHDDKQQKEIADSLGIPVSRVKQRVSQLHEANPMLGHRACRLCITHPEILDMQVRAIVEAAIECANSNIKAIPEIMHPLVGTKKELQVLRRRTEEVIRQVRDEHQFKGRLEIKIGTMIEV